MNEPTVEMSGISVVIADDHAPIRSLVREGLEAGGCEVRGEGATAHGRDSALRRTVDFRARTAETPPEDEERGWSGCPPNLHRLRLKVCSRISPTA